MTSTIQTTQIKPCTLTELAAIYGIGIRTMKKWITPHQAAIGEKHGRIYTALQVKIIFEKLGLPGIITD
jgi:hypothetical protein